MGPNARDLAALELLGIEAVYCAFNHHPIQSTTEITTLAVGSAAQIHHVEGTCSFPEDGRKIL